MTLLERNLIMVPVFIALFFGGSWIGNPYVMFSAPVVVLILRILLPRSRNEAKPPQ